MDNIDCPLSSSLITKDFDNSEFIFADSFAKIVKERVKLTETINMNFKLTLFLFFSIWVGEQVLAQGCGTIVTPANEAYLRNFQSDMRDFDRSWGRGFVDIPIQFHIVRRDDQSGGMDVNTLKEAIDQLNILFEPANVRFIMAATINYIDDSEFFIFQKFQEEELAASNDVDNVLNIYCMDKIFWDRASICGYAYLPEEKNKNRIFMVNECFDNNSTFPHEVGHFFGLYHTHGKSKDGKTNELVNRTDKGQNEILDCFEKGDECCDTPADPNLGFYPEYCLPNCTYQTRLTDLNGVLYQPDVNNLMSYNPHKNCRKTFSPQQYNRITVIAREERNKLHLPMDDNSCEEQIKAQVEFKLSDQTPMPISKDFNLYRFINPYYSGDSFSFEASLQSSNRLYLYILNMDNSGNIVKVFPYKRDTPYITSSQSLLVSNIKLNFSAGMEYTCFLYSKQELSNSDFGKKNNIMMSSSRNFIQKLYRAFGNQLIPLDKVEYKEGKRMEYVGCLEEDKLLPVILEMEHLDR